MDVDRSSQACTRSIEKDGVFLFSLGFCLCAPREHQQNNRQLPYFYRVIRVIITYVNLAIHRVAWSELGVEEITTPRACVTLVSSCMCYSMCYKSGSLTSVLSLTQLDVYTLLLLAFGLRIDRLQLLS